MNGKEIRNVKENKKEKGKECQKKTPRGGVIVANDGSKGVPLAEGLRPR